MRKFAITAAVGLVGISFVTAGANAADLRRPAPAPYMPPLFTWTGFYAGINAGYGFGNDNNATTVGQVAINNATVAAGARPANVGLSPEGFIGGGQIGYNWQTGAFVLRRRDGHSVHGLPRQRECRDDQRRRLPGRPQQRLRPEARVSGDGAWPSRLCRDRTLIYGTGGLAYGGVNNSVNFFGPLPGNVLQFTGGHDSTEVGYAVGGGIEQAFWQNITLKAEYLYYNLGDTSVNVNVIPGSGGVGTAPATSSTSRTKATSSAPA